MIAHNRKVVAAASAAVARHTGYQVPTPPGRTEFGAMPMLPPATMAAIERSAAMAAMQRAREERQYRMQSRPLGAVTIPDVGRGV